MPPKPWETLTGFTALAGDALAEFIARYGLCPWDADDLAFCRDYFRSEQRDPTLTEIRMIDTYWSDHCRHTTFLTTLDSVKADKPAVEKAFARYLALRKELGRERKPMNLMDIATIGAKALRARGGLANLDISDEINACSIVIEADVNGIAEPWLLMFKNETHNHPTEIEPFGGAATCIGGAIRDPLSGRTYVYQAMRGNGRGQSAGACGGNHEGQATPAETGDHGGGGLQRLRQPDRPCHRAGGRNLPPRLRR